MYVKVGNYKEPEGTVVVEEKPLDKKAQMLKEAEKAKLAAQVHDLDPNAEPPFEIERISNKIMMIPNLNQVANAFVHHTGKFTFLCLIWQ